MSKRPIEEVLESLDKPAQPRAEFAEALSRRLMTELTGEPAIPKLPKPKRPLLLRRPALVGAAAALAIALLVAGIPFLSQPRTAVAAVQDARRKFKDLPPFHAVIERIRSGDVLGEELRTEVPDERVVTEIWYASDIRWRREQVENSWDALGNPALLQDRPGGSFQVADGEIVAEYNPRTRRLSVAPVDEQRPIELRSDATGNLAPEPYGKLLNFRSEFFKENCVLFADARLLERTARHIRCKQPGGSFETWLDKETGLILNHRHSEGLLFRVKSVEFSPTFPLDTFALSAPEGSKVQWAGEKPAPDRFRIKPGPEVVAVIPVGVTPGPIAYGEGSIWVATNLGSRYRGPSGPFEVMRIDPTTNRVVATIPTGGGSSLVAAGGYIWVGIDQGSLQKIDPKTNRASEPVKIGGFPGRLTYGDGSLWFLSGSETESLGGETARGSIARIDPTTGKVMATIPFGGGPWGEPSVGFGSVWVPVVPPREFKSGQQLTLSVHRVDTATNQVVATIDLGAPGWVVGAFPSGVWVPNPFEHRPTGTVTRIDPVTNRIVAVVPVGFMPVGVLEAGDFIWVMNQGDGTVTKIDPRTNQVVGEITVGAGPARAVFAEGHLWITNNGDGTVVRVRI